MALQFVDPKTVGLSVNVDLNANGNIAQTGDTAAGQKTVTINGFKLAGTVDNANTVFTKVLGDIGGATYTLNTAKKKYEVSAKEVE